jgi:hypothetical protein
MSSESFSAFEKIAVIQYVLTRYRKEVVRNPGFVSLKKL